MEMPKCFQQRNEQIIEHIGYTVSYNLDWNIPNWVAYSLTNAETLGTVPREKNFYPDPAVKINPIETKDYNGVGKMNLSRGHMAPAGDMKWSEQAMHESCYMTNICPQNSSLNNHDWKALEEHVRDWAKKYGEVYIACGPIVEQNYQTLGNRHIVIPQAFYKVILRKKNNTWTAIGFIMLNQAGEKPLMTYIHTVDEIEEITGIDFFCNLPDDIENEVESNCIISDWTL